MDCPVIVLWIVLWERVAQGIPKGRRSRRVCREGRSCGAVLGRRPPLLIAPKGVRHRGSGCCVGNERGAAFLGTGVWVLVLVWEMGFF